MPHELGEHRIKPICNTSVYENIQHFINSTANVTVTSIRSSAYHWHYDYELIAVLKGKIEVLYGLYGSEAQKLSAGDLIIINPKGVHGVRGIELDNICLCIQFSADLFEPVPVGMKYRFFLNSTSEEFKAKYPYKLFMETAAKVCIAHRKDSAGANLHKNAWLYMLLGDLAEGAQYELYSAPANNEKNTELVMSISSYIDDNLTSKNLPDSVYKKFGISEKGMYRLLKEILGLTLKELIDTARIERACMLLQDSNVSLQFISDACGYSGETTFYRRFKSTLGITPGQYRNGVKVNSVSNDIQDYLSFDESEVDSLLHHWAGIRD